MASQWGCPGGHWDMDLELEMYILESSASNRPIWVLNSVGCIYEKHFFSLNQCFQSCSVESPFPVLRQHHGQIPWFSIWIPHFQLRKRSSPIEAVIIHLIQNFPILHFLLDLWLEEPKLSAVGRWGYSQLHSFLYHTEMRSGFHLPLPLQPIPTLPVLQVFIAGVLSPDQQCFGASYGPGKHAYLCHAKQQVVTLQGSPSFLHWHL